MTKHLSVIVFHKYTAKTGGICWEGLDDHHIQTRPCNSIEKRKPILFSFVKEQTGENANMLIVTNVAKNIQKPRRVQEMEFSVKMS